MNPESKTKNFRGFVMSKKRKKHGYAERLNYMHMLENGLDPSCPERNVMSNQSNTRTHTLGLTPKVQKHVNFSGKPPFEHILTKNVSIYRQLSFPDSGRLRSGDFEHLLTGKMSIFLENCHLSIFWPKTCQFTHDRDILSMKLSETLASLPG